MNIGLTGGIACGKSIVAAMLADRGAFIVDADLIAREVVEPGSVGLERIVQHFGRDMLLPDGSLHRQELGKRIFADPKEREVLDGILHPLIIAEISRRMDHFAADHPDKLVVADVPLLYESGMEELFEEVMVVYAPPSLQTERLMERNGLTREEAEQRITSQMSIGEKAKRADILIHNDGTLEQTERQIADFWRQKGLS
ncbi:dephospho-CoA kinase [Gorillibacterium timonense]|uniref:dephospho-CoA kinase n=1 Tax=Gorillibacterium timonense TaxID=1689269 RepID=UPI00071E5F22|nr:dephospho-CoA kinase [Gorillibacterium timonense]